MDSFSEHYRKINESPLRTPNLDNSVCSYINNYKENREEVSRLNDFYKPDHIGNLKYNDKLLAIFSGIQNTPIGKSQLVFAYGKPAKKARLLQRRDELAKLSSRACIIF